MSQKLQELFNGQPYKILTDDEEVLVATSTISNQIPHGTNQLIIYNKKKLTKEFDKIYPNSSITYKDEEIIIRTYPEKYIEKRTRTEQININKFKNQASNEN